MQTHNELEIADNYEILNLALLTMRSANSEQEYAEARQEYELALLELKRLGEVLNDAR